jgi:hypothetical protein
MDLVIACGAFGRHRDPSLTYFVLPAKNARTRWLNDVAYWPKAAVAAIRPTRKLSTDKLPSMGCA